MHRKQTRRIVLSILIIFSYKLVNSQSLETVVEDKQVASFSSIAFQDSLTGWAVGWGGTIYKFNHGKWAKYKSPVKYTLNKVFVDDTGNGWIVGDHGTVLKLIDNEWVEIHLGIVEGLNDIYYNYNFGYIVGNNGLIYKYVKNNWEQMQSGTREHLYCVRMSDKKNGFILGWNRTLISISGDSFKHITKEEISQMNHPYYYFYAIEYIGKDEGYIFGAEIVHFHNNTFEKIKNVEPRIVSDSEKVNNELWLVGNSNVYRFSDNKLIEIKDNYYQNFNSIGFSSSKIGWIAAEGGLIIKLTK